MSLMGRLEKAAARDGVLPQPRRFYFDRMEDATGVSGTGIVAYGVMFGDGTVCVRWCSEHRSTAVYAGMVDVEAIHGHDGRTKIVWMD